MLNVLLDKAGRACFVPIHLLIFVYRATGSSLYQFTALADGKQRKLSPKITFNTEDRNKERQ